MQFVVIAKKIMSFVASSPFLWNTFGSKFVALGRAFEKARRFNPEVVEAINSIFHKSDGFVVMDGPFKGMHYFKPPGYASSIYRKLLGSYERELYPAIESLTADYQTIINIGSSERYYSVGMALRYPNATVHAFDTLYKHSTKAYDDIMQLAELNSVKKRIVTGEFCSAETLIQTLDPAIDTLLIIDCEGYEKELLNDEVVNYLSKCNCDLIIETHDCIDAEITTVLRSRFASTHKLNVVKSITDSQKIRDYQFPVLAQLNQNVLRAILSENRDEEMEWFILTPSTAEAS